MKTQRITFTNHDGVQLSGLLDVPVGAEPRASALFAHCFTCSKNLKAVGHIAEALTAEGLAVLRFDFTGLGQSQGDFADTTFSSNVDDLVAAAEYLGELLEPPQILIGHSLGGAAVLQARSHIPTTTGVAVIGAPAKPSHVERLLVSRRDEIERRGESEVEIAGRRFTIRKSFLDDLAAGGAEEAIENLGAALLILHSPIDQVVGIDNASSIFLAARHPKSFVSLDTADHLLTDEADARYAGNVISAWAGRFLDRSPPTPVARDPADNRVVVRTGRVGFRTDVLANRHRLVADEPVRVGGTDAGPSPYELLVAALGTCTTMTLRMYADRKGWPLHDVEVRLGHQKVHSTDCAGCEESPRAIDRISRELILEGPLDERQRQRLLEIADRCPVHRTLHGEIAVDTSLAETPG